MAKSTRPWIMKKVSPKLEPNSISIYFLIILMCTVPILQFWNKERVGVPMSSGSFSVSKKTFKSISSNSALPPLSVAEVDCPSNRARGWFETSCVSDRRVVCWRKVGLTGVQFSEFCVPVTRLCSAFAIVCFWWPDVRWYIASELNDLWPVTDWTALRSKRSWWSTVAVVARIEWLV